MIPVSGRCGPDRHQRIPVLQFIYFTLAAALLYLASNWIVDCIEMAAGKRFENRSLLFFGILLTLALISFSLIRTYTGNP